MPYMTANSYWGLASESGSSITSTTNYGVAAIISTFTPISGPKLTPNLKWMDDSDFRGSPVMHYDQVPGVRHDSFSGKTFLYSDVYPNLIRGVLGGMDSYAASIHTIGVLNSPSVGSQAPSYTINNYSVDNYWQMTGCRVVDLAISFSAEAAVETSFNFIGNPAASVANASVAVNESTQSLVPSWSCSASIASTPGGTAASVAVVESGTLDIKRNTAPIHTLGQQAPYRNFQGPIDVGGQLNFVMESDVYYNLGLGPIGQQVALYLKFTDPETNAYVYFQMSNVQLMDPQIDQSKAYISLSTKYVAIANTTDAIPGTGYSPILCKVFNSVATAY